MKTFEIEKFRNPDNKFYPVYGWVWNEVLDKEEIKKQLDEMYEQNILGVYVIPLPYEFRPYTMLTNLQPPYLSDGYFEMLSFAVDYAAGKGMEFWIYDEAGWPSGNANFLVTDSDKSFRLTVVDNGKPVVMDNFADLTNLRATEKFIELTHQQHKEKMGESFKNFAPFVFTDEPNIRNTPFSDAIKEEYKKRTGKELDPEKISVHNDSEFNIIYHDICAQCFADNYFAPIKKWCNDNDMLSTGHLNGEDETLGYNYGYHQPMRLLRLMDVPGIDTIWGQIDIGKECNFFPRLASSAAEQVGSGLSLTESMSVYGVSSYERTRFVIGHQLVRGVNVLNPLLLMYDNTGYYSIRQRPDYSQEQPGIEYLKGFNKYLASLQYITQVGKPDNDIALYMPMRSFWADDEDTKKAAEKYEKLGADIERNHGQFDIVDDDLILNCNPDDLKCGKLTMGRACYTKLYIPADKYMPCEVRAQLEIFVQGGGKIYNPQNAEFYPLADISGDNQKLRVHKRKCDNCDVYIIFNEGEERVNAKINFPEKTFELNAFDGKKYSLSDEYSFECGEIRIFITAECNAPEIKPIKTGKKLMEITDFEIKPTKRFTIDTQSAKYVQISGEVKNTACGDWKDAVGEAFSGECEYTTHFNAEPDGTDLVLSLGKVCNNCEVIVNGHHLCSAIKPPYKFVIDKSFIKECNELVIKVSNTAANAFVHYELPKEWEEKHIGPYHKIALEQEKKSVSGGIYGPVELYGSEV